jgi:hypothetical protein
LILSSSSTDDFRFSRGFNDLVFSVLFKKANPSSHSKYFSFDTGTVLLLAMSFDGDGVLGAFLGF